MFTNLNSKPGLYLLEGLHLLIPDPVSTSLGRRKRDRQRQRWRNDAKTLPWDSQFSLVGPEGAAQSWHVAAVKADGKWYTWCRISNMQIREACRRRSKSSTRQWGRPRCKTRQLCFKLLDCLPEAYILFSVEKCRCWILEQQRIPCKRYIISCVMPFLPERSPCDWRHISGKNMLSKELLAAISGIKLISRLWPFVWPEVAGN